MSTKNTAKKRGKLFSNGIKLESHEMNTVEVFLVHGFDIELIKPIYIKKNRNADILMLGKIWEMKSPTTKSPKTLKNKFSLASSQAENLIFDLRRINIKQATAIKELRNFFKKSSRVNNLKIVTKTGEILDIND